MVDERLTTPICPRPELGDFYSPFFRVRFFSSIPTVREFEKSEGEIRRENANSPIAFTLKDQPIFTGEQFHNSQGVATLDQAELDSREIENYAADLEVVMPGGEAAQMTLTLTPPYDEAVAILRDRVIAFRALALVEFGYASPDKNDILSGPFLFRLSNPQCEFGDQISITLHGYDILTANLARRETKRTWKRGGKQTGQDGASGGSYPTDLRIVEDLVNSLDMTLDVSSLSIGSPLRATKENALEQRENDWIFLKNLIHDNLATFIVCGKILVVFDRGDNVRRPSYRFLYRAQLQNNFDAPIENAAFTTKKDLFAGRKSRDITKITPNRDQGGAMEETITTRGASVNLGENVYHGDRGNERVTKTSQGSVKTNKALGNGQTGSIVSGSEKDDHLKGRVQSIAEKAGLNSGITGTITTPGIPALRPDQRVVIDGVPDYYKGEYRINKVTHRVGTSGYRTEALVTRQGFISVLPGTVSNRGRTSDQQDVGSPTIAPREVSGR